MTQSGSDPQAPISLNAQVVFVTAATNGIGVETAKLVCLDRAKLAAMLTVKVGLQLT